MGTINAIHLPETAVATDNCLDRNFIFYKEASLILEKLDEILKSFIGKNEDDLSSLYYNNVIGVIGKRGSGKTSLMGSVIRTLRKNGGIPKPGSENGMICGLVEPIDPKSLPDYFGIIDLFLGLLFSDFTQHSNEYEESKIDGIFQLFEKANQIISLLAQKDRKDVLLNSSDLYQLSALASIKDMLARLVDELLNARRTNDRRSMFKAFLICIDDFDLDSTNCYTMAIELMSFLNIKGVIFLLGMDADIFETEICRNRIRELSDYGNASSSVFDGYRPLGLYAQRTGLTNALPFAPQIAESAREYSTQLSMKFIPADFRVSMGEHDIGKKSEELDDVINYFCYWLFGFSKRDLHGDYQEKAFYHICDAFSSTLRVTSNLRSRNQILNKIIAHISDSFKKTTDEERRLNLLNSGIDGLLRNYPSVNIKGRLDLKELASEIEACKTRFYNLGHYKQISSVPVGLENDDRKFVDFFAEHPCGLWAYNKLAPSDDPNNPTKVIEELHDFLSVYSKLLGLDVSPLVIDNEGSISFDFDRRIVDKSSYLDYLPNPADGDLLDSINVALKAPKKQTKRFYSSLFSNLLDYGISNSIFPSSIADDIRDLQNKLEKTTPWRGESETKRQFLDFMKRTLERAKRYLR